MQLYIRKKKHYDKEQKPDHCKKKTTATSYNLKQITMDQKYQFAILYGVSLM